jgi:small-conductance mechanosensitive channel
LEDHYTKTDTATEKMNTDTENTAAAAAVPETIEGENTRLARDNAWLKSQLAAAEKALALKHIPLPTLDQEDGDDPDYWSYAGLVAKYCAALRREAEYVDGRTELVARLYLKEMAAGAHFTVSEGAAADAVIRAEKRIYALKARLAQTEANVGAYKRAWEKEQDRAAALAERVDELEGRIEELEAAAEGEGEGDPSGK